MRGWMIASLVALACEPRPVLLPDAHINAMLAVDADRAIALLLADDGKSAWLTQLDADGHASWVRPLPDMFAGDLPSRGGDFEWLYVDGPHAVLRFLDRDTDPPREHRLGFSLADGTPRWHHAVELEPGSVNTFSTDRGQALSLHDHDDRGTDLVVFDLATGTQQFTRRLADAPYDLDRRVLVFADLFALLDDQRGVVLVRRSDGVVRATLPLAGAVCALGETLIGLRDDAVIAHDLANLAAPPRVLGEGLADLLEDWPTGDLRSCHRRGEDIALQFHTGDTYLVTLGVTRREVTAFEEVRELALLPEIADLVPDVHRAIRSDNIMAVMAGQNTAPYVFAAYDLAPGAATEARRIEPLIHTATYQSIERFDGGYLAVGSELSDNLLSLDARAEAVTGAVQVSHGVQKIGPDSLAAGHLWLIGDHTRAGSAPLRVLDARTLAPVGGDDFTIFDRTQEAQAAWLPPRSATTPVIPPAPVPRPPAGPVTPGPNNLAFTPPPWDMTQVHARLRALGYTDRFELLAWASHTRGMLLVAHVLDADGPRWTFVALKPDGDVWKDDLPVSGRARDLRRRPTHRDLEGRLRAIGLSTRLAEHPKDAPTSSPIDARLYLEVTGEPPRWRSRAAHGAAPREGP